MAAGQQPDDESRRPVGAALYPLGAMAYGPELQFAWKAQTRVVFGAGKLERLGKEVAAMGSRVLLVTDPFLSTQEAIVGRAVDSLRRAELEVQVFDGVESDPSIEAIDTCSPSKTASA